MRLGDVRLGNVRLGNVRLGDVRLGDVRLGDVRLEDVRLGDRDNSGYKIVSTQGVLKLLKTSWAAMEDFPVK